MECKDVFIRLVGTKLSVLIETLWNVKCFKCSYRISCSVCVLIETLWNVKWRNEKTPYLKEIVLIETLWNVKLLKKEGEKIRKIVLIETLWSVKDQEQFFT